MSAIRPSDPASRGNIFSQVGRGVKKGFSKIFTPKKVKQSEGAIKTSNKIKGKDLISSLETARHLLYFHEGAAAKEPLQIYDQKNFTVIDDKQKEQIDAMVFQLKHMMKIKGYM